MSRDREELEQIQPAILVVDDDPVALELITVNLEHLGFRNVITQEDGEHVVEFCRTRPISLIILDLFLPGISGIDVLEQVTEQFPRIPVIVVTVNDSVDAAVRCMKHGAFDFMTKPLDRNRLGPAVGHALRVRDLEQRLELFGETSDTSPQLRQPETFERIITASPRMHAVFQYVEAIAPSPAAVLVTGESGTGKELLARAIHDASGRNGAFVAVNAAGLDDVMFSDTLFGHERGAYTGADRVRQGLIEKARGGTLFLDEIGDLETSSQIKLLRLLQEGEYYPLGSDEARLADVRVVAATNADLLERQERGVFRRDLYYRLLAHFIRIPALRDRPEDIPVLARHFAAQTARALGIPAPRMGSAVTELLRRYSFPGNVRELQSLIADAVSQARGGEIQTPVIQHYIDRHDRVRAPEPRHDEHDGARFSWSGPFPTLEEVEWFLIDEALARSDQNQSAAARLLGVAQSTLSRRIAKRA